MFSDNNKPESQMMRKCNKCDQYHDPAIDCKEKMTIDVDEAYNRIESMEVMLPNN